MARLGPVQKFPRSEAMVVGSEIIWPIFFHAQVIFHFFIYASSHLEHIRAVHSWSSWLVSTRSFWAARYTLCPLLSSLCHDLFQQFWRQRRWGGLYCFVWAWVPCRGSWSIALSWKLLLTQLRGIKLLITALKLLSLLKIVMAIQYY